MDPTSLYGLQQLVAQNEDYNPDTLRMHPVIQYALLRDPEIPPIGRWDRLAGCDLIVDEKLPRGGWQLLHGDEQIATGTAAVTL